MRLAVPTLLILIAGLAPCCAQVDYRQSADARLLREHGVEPDAAGVRQYLQGLRPSPQQTQRIAGLIADLGAESFSTRENAHRELQTLAHIARGPLQSAANSKDPEVRQRAKSLLRLAAERPDPVLPASLRTIERGKLAGLADCLIGVLPLCDQLEDRDRAARVLAATASPDDAELLKKTLTDSKDAAVRRAVVVAVPAALGEDALATLTSLLVKEQDPWVRLAAASGVARHDPRRALASLVKLLAVDDVTVRVRSIALLSEMTGDDLGFVPYHSDDARQKAINRWQQWLTTSAATAKLTLPTGKRKPLRGRILLGMFHPYRLVELDLQGKKVFEQEMGAPCGVQGLPNGHRVIADWSNKAVVELDAAGKELHRHGLPGTPNGLHRLENGHSLVGLFNDRQVFEIDATGRLVWQVDVAGQPTDSRRLPNGNTLVALYGTNRVVEIDRTGREVWTIENVPSPESARRLPNGNTLVASSSDDKVIEYTGAGKIAWQSAGFDQAYDALVLEGGNILVGYRLGIREITREEKTVRQFDVGTVRRICVY